MARGQRIAKSALRIAWILASAGLSAAFLPPHLPASAMSMTASATADDGASSSPATAATPGDLSSLPRVVHRYESPFFPAVDSDAQQRIPSALIMLNTPISSSGASDGKLYGALGALWDAASFRVCADGGANRLYDATINMQQAKGGEGARAYLPDVITGDLDSVRQDVREYYEARGVAIVRVEDQNHHDLDKSLMAVEKWIEKSCNEGRTSRAFIYGAFGGRFDQEMGCVNAICVWGKKEAFERTTLALYNEETCAFALKETPVTNEICLRYPGDSIEKEEEKYRVGEGPTCGLIPILGRCEKVVTTGLKWNLDGDVPLEFGGLVSSSNRALDDVVTVETSSPLLFTAEMMVKHNR